MRNRGPRIGEIDATKSVARGVSWFAASRFAASRFAASRFAASRFAGLPLACVVFGALGSACASHPAPAPKTAAAATALAAASPAEAPLKLLTLAEARPTELGTVSVTSVDRLLTNGATLVARAVPLPIDPSGLRDMLLGQAGLPPEVSANLDLGAPSGAAVVATGAPGATGAVMAVAARGPAEAARVIAALGRQIARRGDVVLVDNGTGGRGWLWRDGSVIVFSDDVEALARGARLAEEARHGVAEDVTAVLYPDAIARANGTDVKTALAGLMAMAQAAEAAQAADGKGPPPQSLETVADMMEIVADAAAIEIGLSVDPGKGLTLRTRWRARPGSRLEALAREVHPFELDASVLSGDPMKPPAAVLATSIGSFMRSIMTHQRGRVAEAKVQSALDYYDAYLDGIAGQTSGAVWFSSEAPIFGVDVVYPMKDAAAATRLAEAVAHLDKKALGALIQSQLGSSVPLDITIKKESAGKLKASHLAFSFRKLANLGTFAPDVIKKVFGGPLDLFLANSGTRVVATIGRGAKASLGRVAVGAPIEPTGPLADALAASKSRDAFYYFDVASLLPLIAKIASDKHTDDVQARRLAPLAQAGGSPIPLYGTAGGDGLGQVWSADLTIPTVAFVNAGVVVKAEMAASLGGGAAPPADAPAKSEKKKKKKGGAHEK
jgi:hypothetical protein